MNEQKDKVTRIKATYSGDPRYRYQAHKPTNDAPDSAKQDFVVVLVAILVILLMVFLASLVPGHPYTHA